MRRNLTLPNKTNAYLKAAERIGTGVGSGICGAITTGNSSTNFNLTNAVEQYFEPTKRERKKYMTGNTFWGYSSIETPRANQSCRILMLLFMHEMVNNPCE